MKPSGPETSAYSFVLDPALIAQRPAARRDQSRMMILRRAAKTWEHGRVGDLPDLLRPGDLMVVNDSRVIPARLYARKPTGARIELLFLEPRGGSTWEALARGGRARPGRTWDLETGTPAAVTITDVLGAGRLLLDVRCPGSFKRLLEREGIMPLPPYIRRGRRTAASDRLDRERYQTVYARTPGSVAAPTAGLHFTDALLGRLEQRGVGRVAVTLHVGLGTFRPVQAERVEDHVMEAERYTLPPDTAARIRDARARTARVLAVGSTVVRTLEHAAGPDGLPRAGHGRTTLFIHPPYRFQVVDAMLTNFHLPRSTLLMMVCALAGTDFVLAAYREAVAQRYRFYSYGDCMLIL